MSLFSLLGLRRRAPVQSSNANPRPPLDYPLSPSPRVAVIGADLGAGPEYSSLPQWTVKQLESARPQALAGPMRDIEEVASLRELGILRLKSLSYPLVIFTSEEDQRLSDADHDRIWRWFRLPVFEQIRAADGRLLAWECESRDGFHLASGAPASIQALCGCRVAHVQSGMMEIGGLTRLRVAAD